MVLNQSKTEMNTNKPFTLRTSNKEFAQRQKNVFDQLNTLQCNLRTDEDMEVEPPTNRKSNRTTKHLRGKESIFKVPQEPPNYLKKIPDFKKNPHKWKKYSLADVKDDDMSESSNTRTALSFLNELKKRGCTESVEDEPPKKILFKKVTHEEPEVKDEDKPSFRSSKVVMPEYVVGQKVKKEKKSRGPKNGGSSQLKLDHLFEDDEG